MNRTLLVKLALLVSAAAAFGQTNSSAISAPIPTNLVLELPPAALSDEPLQAVRPPAHADETPKTPLTIPLVPADLATPAPVAPRPGRLFPLPEPKWLDLPAKIELSNDPPAQAASSASIQWSQKRELYEAAQVSKLESQGLFIVQDDDSEFDRAINAAFRPEVIHLGHFEFTSSIITAIARRNPLCLLDPNPIVVKF